MMEQSLTKAQERFLKFFVMGFKTVARAWLDKDRIEVTGPPETWVYLKTRGKRMGNTHTVILHADRIVDLRRRKLITKNHKPTKAAREWFVSLPGSERKL